MDRDEVKVRIGARSIGLSHPTYFIADIGSNHEGSLDRAIELIHLAKESGADAAKFQHFLAETIVSDYQFHKLGKIAHQKGWGGSVFDVYKAAETSIDWVPVLKKCCDEVGIEFLTTPYDPALVPYLTNYLPAFKVGSGDITWLSFLALVSSQGRPVLLATGASDFKEVKAAVDVVSRGTSDIILMQCNTNYTGHASNSRYVNLNVLNQYKSEFPSLVLGLSDHTIDDISVLGAVALGARVVEKHFTDDNSRVGPDHQFAITPQAWRTMVDRVRCLEYSLGNGIKVLEDNEAESVVVQRRSLIARRGIPAGTQVTEADFAVLRPCPPDAVPPSCIFGRKIVLGVDIAGGDYLRWDMIKSL